MHDTAKRWRRAKAGRFAGQTAVWVWWVAAAVTAGGMACGKTVRDTATATGSEEGGTLRISAPAFADGGAIPARYTCTGADDRPALRIDGVPGSAKSLALIVEDPDAPDPAAPQRIWVHLVAYNMAPTVQEIPAGKEKEPIPGASQGRNDWGETGWRGPCPPIGRHRYYFRLYALDAVLPDLHQPTKAQLEQAMEGHVVGKAVWMGTFAK